MTTPVNSSYQAILAAKKGDWPLAIELNEAIVATNPQDHAAFNRLGIAHLQTKNVPKAVSAFKNALSIDKNNIIAKKNLKKAQSTQKHTLLNFSQPHFIEEPGKTKIIKLHRLADKGCLNSFPTGFICSLRCKKRYISIEAGSRYLGALPEDISFRLARLILGGNQYACYIYETNNKNCSVFIKEILRSKKNKDVSSFPVSLQPNETENSDMTLLDDNIPVENTGFEIQEAEEIQEEVDLE